MSFDPEAERPRNYIEAISGDQTWDSFGIRIKWTEPIVPGDFRMATNEPIRLRLCVETKKDLEVPPEALSAWCWTPIKFKENPCGIWKEIKLHYNPRCTQWDDHGITSYVFQSQVTPVVDDHYRLTFNVKYNNVMIWANYFQVDNVLAVEHKPSVATQTIIYPSVHFASNFTDKGEKSQQSGAEMGGDAARNQGGSKKTPKEGDDLEMLVLL